jgi:flagellar motor switch protein FliN/FliY
MTLTAVNPIELPLADAPVPSGAPLLAKDMGLVGHVPVMLTAVVGHVSLSIESLFALRKGDLLPMEEPCDSPVTLLLNGKAVARGELVAVEENLGLRITELA